MTYVTMKISNERPPIWDEVHEHFIIDDTRTIYTYGEVIYNPAGVEIDIPLYRHEETHCRQQKKEGPRIWWDKYFSSPTFRAEQEAEAYGVQYRTYCITQKDRNARMRYMLQLADALASGMYGLTMKKDEARKAIQRFADRPLPHSPTASPTA